MSDHVIIEDIAWIKLDFGREDSLLSEFVTWLHSASTGIIPLKVMECGGGKYFGLLTKEDTQRIKLWLQSKRIKFREAKDNTPF